MSGTPQPGLLPAGEKRLRVLHWIRHGQYSSQEVTTSHLEQGALTPRGREQTRHAALALGQWPIRRIYTSDMLRAVQTAEILAGALNAASVRHDPRMRECAPTRIPGRRIPRTHHVEARNCLDGILADYFQPVRATRHELFVAHGNLIRALVARVLGGRRTSWLRMRLHHLGLTRFLVRSDGRIHLLDFNSLGHLPGKLIGET